MKRLFTIFVFILISFFVKSQNVDTINFSRTVGTLWSSRNFIIEDITFLIDTSTRLKYNHKIYKINKQKTSQGIHVYDTISKKGNLELSKYELSKLKNYLNSNLEVNDRKSLYNLFVNATNSDFKKSLKIKNYDLSYKIYSTLSLDEYDLKNLKNDAYINAYINFLEQKRNRFTLTEDVSNELFIRLSLNGKRIALRQDFLRDMGQPYYITKENDSTLKRYLNIETNEVLEVLVKDFKSFKSVCDSKNHLNAYILWYFRNRWNVK